MSQLLSSPMVILGWILASIVIAFLGKQRKFGFFGNFLVSFFLSPLVGVVVLLASDERMERSSSGKSMDNN